MKALTLLTGSLLTAAAVPAFASDYTDVDVQPITECLLAMQVDAPGETDRGWIVDLEDLEWWDVVYLPAAERGIIDADAHEAVSYVTACDQLEVCSQFAEFHEETLDRDDTVHLVDPSARSIHFTIADDASKKQRALLANLNERVEECS